MFRRVARALTGVTAVFLAVSCTESAGPEAVKRQPGVPLFSYSPSGITLDREVGTFMQSGTLLIKGFNPISPHNGDAVIATFYWVGSTNIIDSVADVMTTAPYTHVGNTYHLVKYVTAGGLSMATYVATNIQGFPDAASEPDPVYAVGAWLNQSVTDGGIRLSAWAGVEDVFAQAIGTGAGAPRSASGTGTVPTVASAGPIAYNASALVYNASAAMPPVGTDPDPGFVFISSGSDATMKDVAQYAVPASSGQADPQWTWYFDQLPGGGTWLVTSLTLNAAPPPLPAADNASILGANTMNGFQTSVIPRNGICEYRYQVTNPAPGATFTFTWPGGSQVDDDHDGWIYLPTSKFTQVYTLTVTAPGRSAVQSPPLSVTGSGSYQCIL
jgi:hypothetical protein